MSAEIFNEIVIAGPREKVFDLVTQARFWPHWHPLSRGVAGVIERPYRPGDRFFEWVYAGKETIELAYEVVEHDFPRSATIRCVSPLTFNLRYTFEEADNGTRFTRTLAFADANHANLDHADGITDTQDEQMAVVRLKTLIEDLLSREKRHDPSAR